MDLQTPLFALLAALITGLVTAPFYISFLRKLKLGQQIITEYGPTWHKSKQGVPTMGGFIFMTGTMVSYLIFAFGYYSSGEEMVASILPSSALTSLIVACLLSLMGIADDLVKIKKKNNAGLTENQKLIMQNVIALAFIIYIAIRTGGRTSVEIPFIGYNLELSYFYYVFALLSFVGFVNAVNFTDGIDGLAASVSLPVVLFFMIAAIVKGAGDIAVLSGALAGGLLAFLIFNWNPAKIFMGDTGSMFLGGMIVCIAFSLDMPLMLPVVGIIYLAEALSVVIQRIYYKATKGKRFFKMTPIHHHFELCKWTEVKIVLVFSGISALFCIAATVWVLI